MARRKFRNEKHRDQYLKVWTGELSDAYALKRMGKVALHTEMLRRFVLLKEADVLGPEDTPPSVSGIGLWLKDEDNKENATYHGWMEQPFHYPESLNGMGLKKLTDTEGRAGLQMFMERNEQGLPRPSHRMVRNYTKIGVTPREVPYEISATTAEIMGFIEQALPGYREQGYRYLEGCLAYRPWASDANFATYERACSQSQVLRTARPPRSTGFMVGSFSIGVWNDAGGSLPENRYRVLLQFSPIDGRLVVTRWGEESEDQKVTETVQTSREKEEEEQRLNTDTGRVVRYAGRLANRSDRERDDGETK